MLARRFLWLIAILVMLVIAGAFLYRAFETQLMKTALVPSVPFKADPVSGASLRYADNRLWIARPGIADDPTLWTPKGVAGANRNAKAALFYIHPTTYLERTRWNAPLDDTESGGRDKLFAASQASAFNQVARIWAPKYRQATFGAFLTSEPEGRQAIDFAYGDVAAAFDQFLAEAPKDAPIILAAHSQGSLHLLRLLKEKVAGTPLARRIAAAYVVGWPISMNADLPALGLPACQQPEDAGCILSWQSFAEPAGSNVVSEVYARSTGPTGIARANTPMLCINPLTGTRGGQAAASANTGTLVPDEKNATATLVPALVGARCDAAGFLLIGENPPDLGAYVLPGNNYHVYDYALFWANVRADAARRLEAFQAR